MTFQPWIHGPTWSNRGLDCTLQWSHDLSAMDTRDVGGLSQPLQCGFNGAMTFQPWIPRSALTHPHRRPRLQWSHDLSAMDTPGNDSPRGIGIKLQWSHDLSAMDTCSYWAERHAASKSFNGAMTFQPWIPASCTPLRKSISGFNGAMTFQPWICQNRRRNGAMTFQPWIEGRIGAADRSPRFNGAMTFQPWIRWEIRVTRPIHAARAFDSRVRRPFHPTTASVLLIVPPCSPRNVRGLPLQ